jgi:hypothetical protein
VGEAGVVDGNLFCGVRIPTAAAHVVLPSVKDFHFRQWSSDDILSGWKLRSAKTLPCSTTK